MHLFTYYYCDCLSKLEIKISNGSPGFIFIWNWMQFYVSIHITTTNPHAKKKLNIHKFRNI